jgi:hypothetical protein
VDIIKTGTETEGTHSTLQKIVDENNHKVELHITLSVLALSYFQKSPLQVVTRSASEQIFIFVFNSNVEWEGLLPYFHAQNS